MLLPTKAIAFFFRVATGSPYGLLFPGFGSFASPHGGGSTSSGNAGRGSTTDRSPMPPGSSTGVSAPLPFNEVPAPPDPHDEEDARKSAVPVSTETGLIGVDMETVSPTLSSAVYEGDQYDSHMLAGMKRSLESAVGADQDPHANSRPPVNPTGPPNGMSTDFPAVRAGTNQYFFKSGNSEFIVDYVFQFLPSCDVAQMSRTCRSLREKVEGMKALCKEDNCNNATAFQTNEICPRLRVCTGKCCASHATFQGNKIHQLYCPIHRENRLTYCDSCKESYCRAHYTENLKECATCREEVCVGCDKGRTNPFDCSCEDCKISFMCAKCIPRERKRCLPVACSKCNVKVCYIGRGYKCPVGVQTATGSWKCCGNYCCDDCNETLKCDGCDDYDFCPKHLKSCSLCREECRYCPGCLGRCGNCNMVVCKNHGERCKDCGGWYCNKPDCTVLFGDFRNGQIGCYDSMRQRWKRDCCLVCGASDCENTDCAREFDQRQSGRSCKTHQNKIGQRCELCNHAFVEIAEDHRLLTLVACNDKTCIRDGIHVPGIVSCVEECHAGTCGQCGKAGCYCSIVRCCSCEEEGAHPISCINCGGIKCHLCGKGACGRHRIKCPCCREYTCDDCKHPAQIVPECCLYDHLEFCKNMNLDPNDKTIFGSEWDSDLCDAFTLETGREEREEPVSDDDSKPPAEVTKSEQPPIGAIPLPATETTSATAGPATYDLPIAMMNSLDGATNIDADIGVATVAEAVFKEEKK